MRRCRKVWTVVDVRNTEPLSTAGNPVYRILSFAKTPQQPLAELITAVVSYVTKREGYITKTKLLKLLYLFDVEFYRAHVNMPFLHAATIPNVQQSII